MERGLGLFGSTRFARDPLGGGAANHYEKPAVTQLLLFFFAVFA